MRIAITIVLVLVVAVLGGTFALTHLIGVDDLRAEIAEEALALTGQPLTVGGRVDLSLLPRPTLSFADAGFRPAADDERGLELDVDRVDLTLKPLALLGGDVEVEEIRLVRPVLRGSPGAAEPAGLGALLGAEPLLLAPAGISRLSIVDGRAEIGGPPLERIDLELSARGGRGPFFVEGTFESGRRRFRLDARLGRLTSDPDTTLQLEIALDERPEDTFTLAFEGVVALDRPADLQGRLGVEGASLVGAVEALARALDQAAPAVPLAFAGPFALSGRLEAANGQGDLSDLEFALAGTSGTGRLGFAAGPDPRIALSLNVPELELRAAGADHEVLRAVAGLLGSVNGEVDLTVDRLGLQGQQGRQLRLSLGLERERQVRIRQARVVLPGDTDVAFEGDLTLADEPALNGRVRAVTDRLGVLIGWLGPDVLPASARERVQTLSLEGQLALKERSLRLEDLDLRIDATRLLGTIGIATGPRPRVEADLALDHLNLDHYLPGFGPRAALAVLGDELASTDLDFQLELGRLIWRELRWSGIEAAGRAEGGRLELARLSAQAPADSTLTLSGQVSVADESFDLDARLRSEAGSRLLREVGLDRAATLGRLGPLTADGRFTGWLDASEFEATLALGELQARSRGTIGSGESREPTFDVAIESSHPSYPALLERLGLAHQPEGQDAAPLVASGRLRSLPTGGLALSGHAGLGPTKVTGEVQWTGAAPRPALDLRLSFNEPRVDTLLPLLRLAGVDLQPALLGRPVLGALPAQRLALEPLRTTDAKVSLNGKGGLAGARLEADATLREGRLTLTRGTLQLASGTLGIEGVLDLRDRVPLWSTTLTYAGADGTAVADALAIPAGLGGTLDLYSELRTVGDSPYEMVRGLEGDIALSVKDGFVYLPKAGEPAMAGPQAEPVPLDLLEAQFDVKRGIAYATDLVLETPEAVLAGDGAIDLLVWALDLELREVASGQPRLRLVGPIGDPQVIIGRPAVPMPAEGPDGAP